MRTPSILVIGTGKLGARVALAMAERCDVTALSRRASANKQLSEAGVQCLDADVCQPESLAVMASSYDALVYCLAPGDRNEQAYRALYYQGLNNVLSCFEADDTSEQDVSALEPSRLGRVFFVSSSSVYHQDDGTWIDENSPTLPESFSGRVILEAEALLADSGFAYSIVRFTGIYGGSRSMLRDQVREGRAFYCEQVRLSNRIHEDDCVGFLGHLIQMSLNKEAMRPLYLATDSCPVDLNEVYAWIAEQEGVTLLTKPEAQKRRTGNKRCRNALMRATGYELKYPSYREGYL